MPIDTGLGREPLPVETPDDVAVLVEHLQRGDLEKRFLGDHFAYLAGTRPELFRPYQELVIDGLLDRFEVVFDDLCVLFGGAPDRCVEILAGRLRSDRSLQDAWVLGSIGTGAALAAVAEDVRDGGDRSDYEDSGIWIPPTGPAEFRFTPRRQAVFLELGDFPDAAHPVGLPVDRVVRDPSTSPVAWHYVSLRLADVPGLPSWPASHAHLVGPASRDPGVLFAGIGPDGRYQDERLILDEEPEEDWFEDDPEFGRGRAVLRPYGPDLVYTNGHTHATPGLVGTAGGPPIGLYPNPLCPSCKRLMFHAATVTTDIREHGSGFRSLFLCEDCHRTATTASGWN
ncbi:hypothetical protein [Actinoplanes utahensis]|uniref:Uncharacterized protein n=1 Tax=Actinoplanes utahensis TaxID=1869 RepID=A0A0A6UML6_ACTUT|nr:hypothetical protein [Actinoplanes utahensis]KHD77360.1 hypothetical protein MB27_11410 [Actinoplanes utahensis]GIF32894.1 hypothetical protein Aut01nite_58800 [Actinoplanes utahensis]